MTVEAKICGVTGAAAITAAAKGGARFIGFVFFPRSPRNLGLAEAGALARQTPAHLAKVAVCVDRDDEFFASLLAAVAIDALQLHGSESPERVRAIKAATGKPVIKAIKVGEAADLAAAEPYLGIADRLMFDAKPPAADAAAMPGGNALSFDWSLLAGRSWPCPWILSGGLDPDNVEAAVRRSGATAVDVSSGVESRPGVKDPARIAAFLEKVARL
jgi:phosphoribosylanthranilate isomerase